MNRAVKEALEALAAKRQGQLTPRGVVDEARPPDSPLHPYFEWDDTKAADEYRLDQARALISSVRIRVSYNEVVVKAPLFVRDPTVASNIQGYASLSRLRNDKEAARSAVLEEFRRVNVALDRARALAVALGLDEEIEALRDILDDFVTTKVKVPEEVAE